MKNLITCIAVAGVIGLSGCANTTPYTTYREKPTYGADGKQIGTPGELEEGRPMTHAEAKEEGYDFWARNADQWWAIPVLFVMVLNDF